LEIYGIRLTTFKKKKTANAPGAPVAKNWWTAVLMSMSPACCARLESVLLSFTVGSHTQMDGFS
jgi:hypothetical protein